MDFFDELGNGLKQVGDTIANKTNELAATAKLKMQLAEQTKTLNSLYLRLGKAAYEGNEDDMPELKTRIAAQISVVEDIKAQIEASKC